MRNFKLSSFILLIGIAVTVFASVSWTDVGPPVKHKSEKVQPAVADFVTTEATVNQQLNAISVNAIRQSYKTANEKALTRNRPITARSNLHEDPGISK